MAPDEAAAATLSATVAVSEHTSNHHEQIYQQKDVLPSSTPVEMSQLPPQPLPPSDTTNAPSPSPPLPRIPDQPQETVQYPPRGDAQAVSDSEHPLSEPPHSPQAPVANPSLVRSDNLTRQDSAAIGPASENPFPVPTNSTGPFILITLLLTNGARHPYKIDEKYLKRRNATSTIENTDPYAISVYTMKELIWRDWRDEWETRPTSPSSIRLIYFGKLLDDKSSLKDCRFNATTPNVVHMTLKPQDILEDEENAKTTKSTSSRNRDNSERSVGCRCIIL